MGLCRPLGSLCHGSIPGGPGGTRQSHFLDFRGHLVSGMYIVVGAGIRFGPPHTQSDLAANNNMAPFGLSPSAWI